MDTSKITPRILLIEDAELDIRIFKLVVKKVLRDTAIETCENGKSAIEMLKTLNKSEPDRLPDFIFLDLRMPVMDGWQFLQKYDSLKIDPDHKSRLYILSSSIDQNDFDKAENNPYVKKFISKPIDMAKLKSIFNVSDDLKNAKKNTFN